MTKLEHALLLASKGFRVFPLFPNGKKAAIIKWPDRATIDESEIRKWWSGSHQETNKKGKSWIVKADSNIGICTTGYLVLDVDIKDGPHALESFKKIKELFKLQNTMLATTPTNGFHLYYSTTSYVENDTEWYPGVDIRGDRGFTVAPGSTIDGAEYRWHNELARPVEASESLVQAMKQKPVATNDPNEDFGEVKFDYSKLPDKVPAGQRDDILFKYACSWRERNLSKEQAEIMMRSLFDRVEQTPGDEITWEDAKTKLNNAWDAYKPGGLLDIAVTTQPSNPHTATRVAATLKEAIDHFIFIEEGSKVADTRRRPDKAVMTLQEIKNSMKPDTAGGIELMSAWLRSPHRRTVRDVGYFPQDDLYVFNQEGADYFNTYLGSNLEIPTEPNPDLINLFTDHLKFLLPNPVSLELMLDWMAFTILYPHLRVPWCYLIISISEGLGKGLLYTLMARCVGPHNTSLIQPDELTEKGGTYNGYMSNITLACFDEIKASSVDYERLRLLITSTELMINHKYGSKKMERIFANTLAFSNHLNAIAISTFDRRFYIDCNYSKPKDKYYYDRLWTEVERDLPAHWIAYLKKRDISKFQWSSAPPDTAAKKLMQGSGKNNIESLLMDCIEEKLGPFACDIICASLAFNYIVKIGESYGVDTSGSVTYQTVANVITSIRPPLPQTKYSIPQQEISKTPSRIRCKCIRNFEHWQQQSKEAIAAEYARARLLSLGKKPSEALVEVEALTKGN